MLNISLKILQLPFLTQEDLHRYVLRAHNSLLVACWNGKPAGWGMPWFELRFLSAGRVNARLPAGTWHTVHVPCMLSRHTIIMTFSHINMLCMWRSTVQHISDKLFPHTVQFLSMCTTGIRGISSRQQPRGSSAQQFPSDCQARSNTRQTVNRPRQTAARGESKERSMCIQLESTDNSLKELPIRLVLCSPHLCTFYASLTKDSGAAACLATYLADEVPQKTACSLNILQPTN